MSTMIDDYLPMDRVKSGDSGFLSFDGIADSTIQRLMSMGMIPGAFAKVIRVAPLGDPIMLEVTGYQVCLRRREAVGIRINKSRAPGSSPSNPI